SHSVSVMLYHVILAIAITLPNVQAQLNLGTFNLKQDPNGIWGVNFNQGGSILGFGGDRAFNAQLGNGVLGFGGTQGAVVGGERVGSDSQFGVSPGGVNLGSNVNFGQGAKAGDLNSFIKGIGDFFKNLTPQPVVGQKDMSGLTPIDGNSSPERGDSFSIRHSQSDSRPMDGDVKLHEEDNEELVLMHNNQHRSIMRSVSTSSSPLLLLDQAKESSISDDDSLLHKH
ncbi:hypothetical protein PFISCL1PPCAC_6115, partial [Pristionchus fissidentatus]